MHVSSSRRPARVVRWSPLLPVSVLALLAGGCFDHRPASTSQSANPVGALIDHPDFDPLHPERGSRRLVVEENSGGQASQLKVINAFWGRLVQVRDQLGVLQQSNMVVGEDIVTDGIDFRVETNAITLVTTVTILHPYTPSTIVNGVETSPYQRAFARLDRNLAPVNDKSLDPTELPPFSLVPRNAAIVLHFNDLLDPTRIDRTNLRLVVGYPPSTPLDALVISDPNHGDAIDTDGDGTPEFYPTRVIIDPTITPTEATQFGVTANSTGFPASVTTNLPNLAIRIPTHLDSASGQNDVLQNLSGHPVAFFGNGSNDLDSATRDIVRAARAGGKSEITGDTSNGFLADTAAPKVVGTQAVVIGTPSGGPTVFASSITYLTSTCAMATKVGDILQQAGVFGEITEVAVPVGSQIASVHYRIVEPSTGFFSAGQGTLSTVWDPVSNLNKQACFVRFPSIGSPPAASVATDSPVLVRFNEPMDPDSVSPFETFTVTSFDPATTPTNPERAYSVGRITPSADGLEFRFEPSLPLRHTSGLSEQYWVNVPQSTTGPLDLAGNPLASALPAALFTIDPTEPTVSSGNLILRFSSADEIPGTGTVPTPEVRGQVQVNFVTGELEPRQVARTSIPVDRTQTTLGAMTQTGGGTQTPLSPLGSKMMTLWRYIDVGWVLTDDRTMNMDVEGLSWSPLGGNVVADVFDQFSITLAHSSRLPDEGQFVDAAGNVIIYPNSGLLAPFDQNYLNATLDPPSLVHPRARGYAVNPSDRFIATSGTVMVPYPLNRGIDPSLKSYYTWRDTSILARGGIDSAGAEMAITANLNLPSAVTPVVVGSPWGAAGQILTTALVPTVGLPLLMEFRCYPDNSALGLNVFDVSNVTLNGQPRTRAFAQGGVATGGSIVIRDPELQNIASGGFNPNSTPPGLVTAGTDNVFYLGQLDLVTRVSRAHTIWFDTPNVSTPRYVTPIVDPAPERQPSGTSVILAFRGASQITAGSASLNTATSLDMYGDIATGVTFHTSSTGGVWSSNMSSINGSEFFQTRISFVSNAQTNLTPTLSALGFAYRQ